jgi:type I restriction enzyme M protein
MATDRLSPRRVNSAASRNDFPDLLGMWPGRKTEEGRAWLVPAQKIIDNGYNLTLSGLGLIEAETVEHAEPEEILASVAAKEEQILGLIAEMQELLAGGNKE